MQITHYTVPADIPAPLTVAQIADLHAHPHRHVLAALEKMPPDMIAITGDLFDHLASAPETLPFLRRCAALSPTVYVYGNHEQTTTEEDAAIRACGVVLLQNSDTVCCGIHVGGVNSGFTNRREQGNFTATPVPNTDFLARFAALDGYKLLLCHHPEYYPTYLRDLPIDLVLAGHAHGGQWRLGKRAVFAPGQGFFPRYTEGMHEGRLIVSRGLSNTAPVPRFGNPTELVFVHLQPLDNHPQNSYT